MSLIQKAALSPSEYTDFWLTPAASAAPGTKWGTDAIAFLLGLDATLLRIRNLTRASSAASASSPPPLQQQQPPAAAAETAGGESSDALGEGDAMLRRLLNALHFASLFWEFDATDETFRGVCDRWSAARQRDPALSDALPQELLPALLLGNPGDPFWNYAELCTPTDERKCRPYALQLLRTVLARPSWDVAKTVSDILAQVQTRSLLLPSLLLLRIILSNSVKDSEKIVQNATSVLGRCIFPGKAGKAIEDALRFLELEAKAPGKSFLDVVLEENPWIVGDAPVSKPLLVVECGNRDAERIAGMAKFWKQHQESRLQLRMSLLATILSRELLLPPIALGLQFIRPAEISLFLKEAIAVLDACTACETQEEADSKRREALSEIFSRIVSAVKLHPQSQLVPNTPRIPPLDFCVHLDEAPKRAEDTPKATPLNVPFSTELRRILLDLLALRGSKPRKTPTKIVVIGGDSVLHIVAGTWLCFCKENPRGAEALLARFYLVPAGESAFGGDFARTDDWWRLHVMEALGYATAVEPHFTQGEPLQARPSRDALATPAAAESSEDDVGEDGLQTTNFSGRIWPNPPTMVAQILESLLRDAQVRLPLPMILCQCWSMEGRFEISVPFFSEAAIFPHDPAATTAAAAIQRGGRQPFTALLTFHDAQPDGTPSLRPSNAHNETVRALALSIRQNWSPPFRTSVSLVATASGSTLSSSSGGGGGGGGGSGGSPSITTSSSGGKKSVVAITDAEISLEDRKPLLCVLDRQAFGPFLKVRVTRVPLITFPVAAFLPLGD